MSIAPRKTNSSSPGREESTSPFRVQTIFIALRCWWKLAAPLGLMLALAAAAGLYYFSKPIYTAATWLIIRETPHVLLKYEAQGDQRKFVENQLELLRSPRVIDQVISISGVASTPEIANLGRDPAQALRKLLKIRALGRSDYFVIEFTSVDRNKAALITNEVAKAYIEQQRSNQQETQSLTIKLLEKEQINQQSLVERYRTVVREQTKLLTNTEAFPLAGGQGRVEIRNTTSEIEARLMAAEVEQVMLKAQVEAEKEQSKENAANASVSEIDRQVEASDQIRMVLARIEAANAHIREWERVSTTYQKNPEYVRVKTNLKADEESLKKLRVELRERAKTELEAIARADRDSRIAELERRQANASFTAKILREKLDGEKTVRQTEKGESLELEFAKADYLRASKVYEAISDRILQMRMEQRAPSQVEQFEAAKPPTSPDGEPPYKKMIIVALAALMIPFGCAVALEHFYKRVSSRDHLESVGGISVVGEVTTLPRRSRNRQKVGATANRELQLFEESIDGLRTYLTLVDSLQDMRILAVASAVSREGKTSLAAQLAISLASATGERTLLIDGDTRSPDLHRAFGMVQEPGLVDVLKGTCPIEEAIETEFSDNLHVLTAGRLASSPHRLLGTTEFSSLLEKLKSSYRHIVIDTPPVLPASESLLLAKSADVVVLCVRRDFSRLDQSIEAYSKLRAAGVKVAGAVLNGIPARSYVHRYGAYYQNREELEGAVSDEVVG